MEELLNDYEDFLRQRGLRLWAKDSHAAQEVRRVAHRSDKSYETYMSYLSDPERAANCLICLIHQANFLLDQQLRALEKSFLEEGGFTEKLYRKRKEFRERGFSRLSVPLVLSVLLAIVLVGAGLIFFLRSRETPSDASDLPAEASAQAGLFDRLDQSYWTYRSDSFGFSFQYPEGVKIDEFDDENGKVILGGDKLQIFITLFDESGAITPERIKKDIPSAVVENPTPIKVGGQEALSFVGQGDNFKTAEVWFVYPPEPYPNGNYLYQLTAKLEEAKLLEEVLKTWKSD